MLLKSLKSFYSTGDVSAYGLGSGGSGGGGIIETVYGYSNLGQTFNNTTLTDTFNAYTINQINSRLLSVEGGSATSISVTGTGDVIVGGNKSGNLITLTRGNQSWANLTGKPTTFVPSAHTHSTADITSGVFNIARIPTGTSGSTVALGNHLHTGVYEPVFTKNTAFNKNFGTTTGTVAEGNDSRIVNGQTAYGWGNHASAGYALNTALTTHINKVDNPHSVTKAQVGLSNLANLRQVDLVNNQDIGGVKSFTDNININTQGKAINIGVYGTISETISGAAYILVITSLLPKLWQILL